MSALTPSNRQNVSPSRALAGPLARPRSTKLNRLTHLALHAAAHHTSPVSTASTTAPPHAAFISPPAYTSTPARLTIRTPVPLPVRLAPLPTQPATRRRTHSPLRAPSLSDVSDGTTRPTDGGDESDSASAADVLSAALSKVKDAELALSRADAAHYTGIIERLTQQLKYNATEMRLAEEREQRWSEESAARRRAGDAMQQAVEQLRQQLQQRQADDEAHEWSSSGWWSSYRLSCRTRRKRQRRTRERRPSRERSTSVCSSGWRRWRSR